MRCHAKPGESTGVNRDHGTGVVEFKGSFLAEIHFFELFRRGCPDDESRTRYVNNPTPFGISCPLEIASRDYEMLWKSRVSLVC